MSDPTTFEGCDGLELARRVAAGEVKPEELLEAALDRIARVNPDLHLVPCLWEDEARRSIAEGLPEGPFRGVPFLLKDLHMLYRGQPISNGSRLFDGWVPDHDSELVARYRRAGFVIFGRTASPELGLTATTESQLHGASRNPWNPTRTTGGSSGGAAAAVACGVLPLANASDGGGSIRIPASCCGVFGMKPTRGRTPMGPDVGEGWGGMSTVHAVSRSVRDCAALLDATSGPDVGAPYWAERPARPFASEVGADPGRLRIAVQTRAFNDAETDPDCIAAVESAAQLCSELGHDVVESQLEIDSGLADATRLVIGANVRAVLEDRAARLGRAYGEEDVEPVTFLMARNAGEIGAADYARAIGRIHAAGRQVARHMSDCDVLLTPTMATAPLPIGALSLSPADFGDFVAAIAKVTAFTSLFNASGNPAMSVPLFWSPIGLPIGTQFVGRYADEATLYRLAAQLEEARPWRERRPPLAS
ncbi:MAG: amidase [Myxococcota bacterium]